jgi:hypothetical protein
MSDTPATYDVGAVEPLIATIRGQKAIVDRDLACIYGVKTRRLNEAVKRNAGRFPEDFVFQLTPDEAQTWYRLRSQNATLKRGQHLKYLPFAFTEHGAIMAATVLNSPQAVAMSVFVVRAFVKMRSLLVDQADLAGRLGELEKRLTERLDVHEHAITDIIQQILGLLSPPPVPSKPRKRIGFLVKERRAAYRVRRRRVEP